ncbi:hypothetical protein VPH35_077068 [Triticum aestivum]
MSKANWSPEMTTIFCNLAAKEKEKGNMPLKFLNPTGYKNVEVGFFEQTEKHYSRFTLYRDWLILKNTSTGLGWNDEMNTVIANDECEDVAMNSHKNSVAIEIEKIMEEVLACGADETSDEYFIATKLFAKFENRCFFNNMKTSEGKKNWLRRMYEE